MSRHRMKRRWREQLELSTHHSANCCACCCAINQVDIGRREPLLVRIRQNAATHRAHLIDCVVASATATDATVASHLCASIHHSAARLSSHFFLRSRPTFFSRHVTPHCGAGECAPCLRSAQAVALAIQTTQALPASQAASVSYPLPSKPPTTQSTYLTCPPSTAASPPPTSYDSRPTTG